LKEKVKGRGDMEVLRSCTLQTFIEVGFESNQR